MLSQDVYDYLRGQILEGALEPGSRIVEERLAADLGVSRAPLREAIHRLRRDGLLSGAGRDTRVIELSPQAIRELHLMRATLEALALQSAARLIRAEEAAELRALVEEMRRLSPGDARQMAELDYEFHRRLCKLSGIQRLYDAWHDQHVLFRLWLNVAGRAHEDPGYMADSHGVLLDAVLSRDPARIAREVTRHVYAVGTALAIQRQDWVEDRALLLGEDQAALLHDDRSEV